LGSLPVFVEARIQWIAAVVNTVAKPQAFVWTAVAFASIGTFQLRIARPNAVHKAIDDNYGQCRCENRSKKQNRELACFVQRGRILAG